MPILISAGDVERLYVFPDLEGGQCTGRTKKNLRCNNRVWEHGQEAGYATVLIGGRAVRVYGPLEGETASRYLVQRCRVHPDAPGFCHPEWEYFYAVRHQEITAEPAASDLFGPQGMPPLPAIAAVLRTHLDAGARHQLASMLAAADGRCSVKLTTFAVGARIRAARERAGLSEAEASAAAGLDEARLWRLEEGRMYPTLPALVRLAPALGVTIDELAGLSPRTGEEMEEGGR
ncbi:helix-turn-helix domain-containing protein [Nonomuraea sp. NPDC026600]|uniref:helix-turn-helix domain-containing protein n=1 Tax=Nonomuraea sp. NPDC026600 TaxID=3155363 RepID=UPI0033C55074